jgi:nucleotidyltransferase/DNA polymerase involved in DNA repair
LSPVILYAEVPSFYASVERALDPSLANRPVIVGGDPRRRGLVQDATDDALAAGVVPGMTMEEALQRCPRARAIRTYMPRYREVARQVRACLRRRVERFEVEGLSGAYLDLSDLDEPAQVFAESLRHSVGEELRLPLRAGIGPNKLLARLAAEAAGNGTLEIKPGAEAEFLNALPVARLPGIGRHTEERLAQLGVRQVGELAALDSAILAEALGHRRGLELHALAHGQGESRVRGERYPGSLSQEATLAGAETDLMVLAEQLDRLAQGLEGALRLQGLAARRIVLKLRYADLETTTRSRTLAHSVATGGEIAAVARSLLDRTQAGVRPVRLLGIGLSAFSRARKDDRQLDLFPSRS